MAGMIDSVTRPLDPLPILRGRSIWLRPLEADDAPRLQAWHNNAEVAQFVSTRAPVSTAAVYREIASVVEEQGHALYRYVICVRDGGQAIGTVALQRVDHVNGSAGFDISIGEPSAWDRGYGTEALNVMVDFGFGELRLNRIWLLVYGFNERALRSYEKAGFTREGTFREAMYRRGAWFDVYQLAILRREWEAIDRPRFWELDAPAQ